MKEKLREIVLRVLTPRETPGEEGVTLIELLAVVVILGVIAVIAVPVVGNSITTAKVNTTKQNMAIIAQALARYAGDHDGNYPVSTSRTAFDDLSASAVVTGDLNTYLQGVPQDGWSSDFWYQTNVNGTTFILGTAAKENTATATTGDQSWFITNTQSTPATP